MKPGHINPEVNPGIIRDLHLRKEEIKETIGRDLEREENSILIVPHQGDTTLDKDTAVAMKETPEEDMRTKGEAVQETEETTNMARINSKL